MTLRPFRFGVQAAAPFPGLSWVDTARRIEEWGYDSLLVPDHFGDHWGPIATMTAAAVATSRLTVGCLVFDNDYRHPVVLAKEMATLAEIAPGRVEVGLGAGWMRWDYDKAGMTYDPPGVRVDRFEEGLGILASLLAGHEVTAHGVHYRVSELPGRPVPRITPALIVGGGGPRMLGIAARQADIVAVTSRIPSGVVDLSSALDSAPAAMDEKIRWIRSAAGDRWGSFDLNSLSLLASVTEDAESMAAGVAAMFAGTPAAEAPAGTSLSSQRGLGASLRGGAEAPPASGESEGADAFTVDDVLGSPSILLGTEEEITQRLLDRRERWGFNYVTFQGHEAAESLAPVVARLRGR